MFPKKPREAGPAPATENPAEEKSEGRSSQEIESRLTQQETEGKTYATREWVYHRVVPILIIFLVGIILFLQDVLYKLFELFSGSNSFIPL